MWPTRRAHRSGAINAPSGTVAALAGGPLEINVYPTSILMRRLLIPLVTLLLLAPVSVVGQTTPAVEPGSRVRIVLARQARSAWSPRQVIQGTVTALSRDSLTLRLDAAAAPVTLATTSIARLEVSHGVPSATRSAVLQGVLGAGAGAVYWPTIDNQRSGSSSKAVLIGAAVGAATGALTGALFPQEQWQRVQWPTRPGVERVTQNMPTAPRVSFGGGMIVTHADGINGVGQHVQARVHLAPLSHSMRLQGELLYGHASGSASPLACERVRQCFGRSDETHQFGAGLSVVHELFHPLGPFQPYLVPIGVGGYHRRTESVEHQGPTAICVIGGQVESCPDNPPVARIDYSTASTGVGVNTGFGISARIGSARAFAEMRAHAILERDGYSSSLPITFGIAF